MLLTVASKLALGVTTHLDELMAMHGLPAPGSSNATIAMNPEEATTLLGLLRRPKTLTYVEWGSGGSTELVAWLMLSGFASPEFRAFSIESSLGWMARMRDRSRAIRAAEKQGRLRFLHGDIGATGHLGYPLHFDPDREPARALPYVGLSRRRSEVGPVDLALVDGRFRLACLLEALAHLTPRTGRVLLHDYSLNDPATHSRSEKYQRLLAFYRVAAHDSTLATLRPRAFVNDSLRERALSDALREPI